MLLPHHPLSLWSLQGAVIANELGQYRLEVSLALTQEESDQMLSELAGRDRAESPDTGGRGGITQGVSFEFFESFLSIYSHNTHWVNFEFFQKLLTTLIKFFLLGNF